MHRISLFLLLTLLLAIPLAAQEATPDLGDANTVIEPPLRDPVDLARRYLGYTDEVLVPTLGETYEPGDTAAFFVPRRDGGTPEMVTFELAARADGVLPDVSGVYLWVDSSIPYDAGALTSVARTLSALFARYALRETYDPFTYGIDLVAENEESQQPQIVAPQDIYRLPDVDNDPHIYVLFTSGLGEERDAFVNAHDSLPAELAPAAFTNQHEIIYVNTSLYPNVELENNLYTTAILNVYIDQVIASNFPAQSPWLRGALALGLNLREVASRPSNDQLIAFLGAPDTSIFTAPTFLTRQAALGGQQMFLNYLSQRLGAPIFYELFEQIGVGSAPIASVLNEAAFYDALTGAPISLSNLFADFVLTNGVNFPFGDGRFYYADGTLAQGQFAFATEFATLDEEAVKRTLPPYSADYFYYAADEAETVQVQFEGAATTALATLPTEPPNAIPNVFYYAGGAANADQVMTHAFDLTDVTEATFTYQVWYDLAPMWNYLYLAVSTDDGATWTPVPSTDAPNPNRNGVAYGAGHTGISSDEPPRPFPILGVIIARDGVTLGEISPGGPAETAGLLPNDRVLGYEGEAWVGAPDIVGMLANYAPGDTLSLLIERSGETMDVDVVLDAHPTRIVSPNPVWQVYTADFSPFAGSEILLRFERVSQPNYEDAGAAVDNMRLEPLGWTDDGSRAAEWTTAGWMATENRVPSRWQVQVITGGTDTAPPRVRLSELLDSAISDPELDFTVTLGSGETLILAVSAVTDGTTQPAAYQVGLVAAEG